jgi:Tfp pilus assembly protein PilO
MPNQQRPSLNRLLLQTQLNKFYSHPIARVSFGLILTIVSISFFAVFAIRPTLQTMAELIKQIDDRKVVDQKLALKIVSLTTAQSELVTKQQDAVVLDTSVPSSPNFPLLLTQIEKIASENNVTMGTLVTTNVPIERDPKTVTTTDLESIPLTLSVSGDYPGVVGMLNELTHMQRLIVVDRIDLLPPTEQSATTLNMSLSVRAFAFGVSAQPKTRNLTPVK